MSKRKLWRRNAQTGYVPGWPLFDPSWVSIWQDRQLRVSSLAEIPFRTADGVPRLEFRPEKGHATRISPVAVPTWANDIYMHRMQHWHGREAEWEQELVQILREANRDEEFRRALLAEYHLSKFK